MNDLYVEHVSEAMKHRHKVAGAVAALLSALVHIGVLLWLLASPIRLSLLELRRPVAEDRREPMQVQAGPSQTAWMAEMRELLAGAEAEGGALAALDAKTQARALEVPAAVGTLAPTATDPADALRGPVAPLDGSAMEAPPVWQPRRDILVLSENQVREALPELARVAIPETERAPWAPDILPPAAQPLEMDDAGGPPPENILTAGAPAVINTAGAGAAALGPPPQPAAIEVQPVEIREAPQLLSEAPAEVTADAPLEDFLKARLMVQRPRHGGFVYFRLEVSRAAREVLPTLPKDVLFIQDCSASIAEQRLYFCRQALHQGLALLAPGDRFNIVKFSETAQFGFADWVDNTDTQRVAAGVFIDGMRAEGRTDLFTSIRSVLDVKTAPGRPVVAILITDGFASSGLQHASAIIGRFSEANRGAISVFTLGVLSEADRYLLDLISYCNRGDSRLAEGGRWGIPETLTQIMGEVAQPVLTDVRFQFASEDAVEVYPGQTMNLYSDRPLILHGRLPRDASHLTFQARGGAAEGTADMVFHIDLEEEAQAGGSDIEKEWARQKVYDLIGRYTRGFDAAVLEELSDTARRYRLRIPYRGRL